MRLRAPQSKGNRLTQIAWTMRAAYARPLTHRAPIIHTLSIRKPYAFHTRENGPQRRRSRRLDIGWKATPTCASQ
jgi:hypothetical protein